MRLLGSLPEGQALDIGLHYSMPIVVRLGVRDGIRNWLVAAA
jgi:hypothetical protein